MDFEKITGLDPAKLIKREGKDAVTSADYKRDPVTGRYIIPYTLTDTNLPPNIISGQAQRFTAEQKRVLMEVMTEIQQKVNVQFKEVSEVSAAEKSDRVISFAQGDVTFEGSSSTSFWTIVPKISDKLGIGHIGGCACDNCRKVVLDNDAISQWESLGKGYWEKGGTGWTNIAHETLHTLGLKDAAKISPLITRDSTIMSYTPGLKSEVGIREADFKALQHIFGSAPATAAQTPEPKTPFTPAPPPKDIPLIKPFTPIEIIAPVAVGIGAAYVALKYGAKKLWAIAGGIATAVVGVVGIKLWQSYARGPVAAAESPRPIAENPPASTDANYSILPNPLPNGTPVLATTTSGANLPIR